MWTENASFFFRRTVIFCRHAPSVYYNIIIRFFSRRNYERKNYENNVEKKVLERRSIIIIIIDTHTHMPFPFRFRRTWRRTVGVQSRVFTFFSFVDPRTLRLLLLAYDLFFNNEGP